VNTHAIYSLAALLKHLVRLGRQVPCTLTRAEVLQRSRILTMSNISAIGVGKSKMPLFVPGSSVVCRLSHQSWVSITMNTHTIYSLAALLKHLACLG
jgi:2-oxoisovalerate dehydrogenase E2 component (dihydrolipoyl transacylase)